MSSDISSLNILQDLVEPAALLNSRFVSAPLMEARIRLPESDDGDDVWSGSGFGVSREMVEDRKGNGLLSVPLERERDGRWRWSVDF
jgi:hypothetical protein